MVKTTFDIIVAFIAFLLLAPIMIIGWIVVSIDTRTNGLFYQKRIGQYGKSFLIYKLRTVRPATQSVSYVGRFFRKSKIDELPQIVNILKGDMSFVGPRPDVAGYYDCLTGEERKILDLKPGLTSEASLKYVNEEALLSTQANPLDFNNSVIFPDKVRMNLDYYYTRSFAGDLKILMRTVFRRY